MYDLMYQKAMATRCRRRIIGVGMAYDSALLIWVNFYYYPKVGYSACHCLE